MAMSRTPMSCVQRSLVCDGCERPIEPGEMMIQTGSRWVHADSMCEVAAEARQQARVRAELREQAVRPSALGEKTGPAPARSTAGHTVPKKAMALANTYRPERLEACVACLNGDCGREGDMLRCDMCARGLHRECAASSRARRRSE